MADIVRVVRRATEDMLLGRVGCAAALDQIRASVRSGRDSRELLHALATGYAQRWPVGKPPVGFRFAALTPDGLRSVHTDQAPPESVWALRYGTAVAREDDAFADDLVDTLTPASGMRMDVVVHDLWHLHLDGIVHTHPSRRAGSR